MINNMWVNILDKIDIGILVLNSKQEIIYWNQYLNKLTRTDFAEVKGKKIGDCYSLFTREIYQKFFRDILHKRQSFFCSAVLHDVFIKPVVKKRMKQNMLLEPINFAGEDHIMIQIFDITNQNNRIISLKKEIKKRKIAEKKSRERKREAEKQSKIKSAFLANISHEIRTPLNAIMGFTDILKKEISDSSHKYYLNTIESAGNSLLTLINDILDMSKIEAGKIEIEYNYLDIEKFIIEIKDIFFTEIKNKGLEIILLINDKLLAYKVDETRLRQILINLIGNAVKFTKEGYIKVIVNSEIVLEQKNIANLQIIVEDTGIGIPEKSQDKIFASFTQQNDQKNSEYGGTGLGLTITKRLTELMDALCVRIVVVRHKICV
jgi:signal transduction histidine kinase